MYSSSSQQPFSYTSLPVQRAPSQNPLEEAEHVEQVKGENLISGAANASLTLNPEENEGDDNAFTRLNRQEITEFIKNNAKSKAKFVKNKAIAVKNHLVRNRTRYFLAAGIFAITAGVVLGAIGIGITASGLGAPGGVPLLLLAGALLSIGVPTTFKMGAHALKTSYNERKVYEKFKENVESHFKKQLESNQITDKQKEILVKQKDITLERMWLEVNKIADPMFKGNKAELILLETEIFTDISLSNDVKKRLLQDLHSSGYTHIDTIRKEYEKKAKKSPEKIEKDKSKPKVKNSALKNELKDMEEKIKEKYKDAAGILINQFLKEEDLELRYSIGEILLAANKEERESKLEQLALLKALKGI
jgi:hypothetical protein